LGTSPVSQTLALREAEGSDPPDSGAPPPEEVDESGARLGPGAPESESGSRLADSDPLVNSLGARASNHAERQREAERDGVLVERAQQGDKQAFRQLVERHQRRAFAIAIGLVRDENDAREIVQEAFLRVFRSLDRFQGGSSFFTWLYRIVVNLSIDLIRKPARREAELVEGVAPSSEAEALPFVAHLDGADPLRSIERQQIAGRIAEALDALPSYHRTVILMREVEGMSYQEMAEAMQVSKGTIMSRLFHARQKLQRALVDCYRENVGHEPPDKPDRGSDE
jgi:RNA polymerase sigma-70 factor (ECF subfamily)